MCYKGKDQKRKDVTSLTDIKRNDTEIVRVSKREYKGHEFIDLRIYYQDDEGDYKPTTYRRTQKRKRLCPRKRITLMPSPVT